ncbi:MAG: hypothetical protein R2831_08150 [Chitinophagaceae bacterium]
MKYFIVYLLLIPFLSNAQKVSSCLQINQDVQWDYLGPTNTEEEIGNQYQGALKCVSVNPNNSSEIFIGSFTGGLFHTIDRGQHWSCLTDAIDYPIIGVNDLIVDYSKKPYTITIATGASEIWFDFPTLGIFRSYDGGLTWKNSLPIEDEKSILYEEVQHFSLSADSSLWFAHTPKDILYSQDDGEHWSKLFSIKLYPDFYENNDYKINSILYNEITKSLYFTTLTHDTKIANKNSYKNECDIIRITNFESNPEINKITTQVKKSDDAMTQTNTSVFKLVGFNKTQGIIQRSYQNSSHTNFYTLDFATEQITHVIQQRGSAVSQESIFWRHGLCVNPANPAIVYFAGNLLYKSLDSGKTFRAMYSYSYGANHVPHADIRYMQISKASKNGEHDELYLCTDGGLSYSKNGGESFVSLNGQSLSITQFYGLGSSPFSGIISAGAQDNSIMSYDPKIKKWYFENQGDGYDVAYSQTTPGWAIGQYNFLTNQYTFNDKVPFTKSSNLSVSHKGVNTSNLYAHHEGHFYFADNKVNILYRDSSRWITSQTVFEHDILAMAVAPTNSQLIYISGLWSGLAKSSDGGRTFEHFPKNILVDGQSTELNRIHSICISPYNENEVWLGFGYMSNYNSFCHSGLRIIYSSDGGKTWTNQSAGLSPFAIADIKYIEGSSGSLLAASPMGIFFKENEFTPWVLWGNNLPKSIITEIDINYCRGKIIVSSYGRGLWESDLPLIKKPKQILIKKNTTYRLSKKIDEMTCHEDIKIKNCKTLTIDCVLHMAKGKKIYVKDKNQVVLTERGKIVNECGENWGGIVVY